MVAEGAAATGGLYSMPRHSLRFLVAVCMSWPEFISALYVSCTVVMSEGELCLLSVELDLDLPLAPSLFGLMSKLNGVSHQSHFLAGFSPSSVQPKQSLRPSRFLCGNSSK